MYDNHTCWEGTFSELLPYGCCSPTNQVRLMAIVSLLVCVWVVQVLSSAEIRDALKEAEAENKSESSSHDSATATAGAASPDLSMPAAQPQGYVEQWLASSSSAEQQSKPQETAAAEATGSTPSVAGLVQQFEVGSTDQPAAAQPSLTEPVSGTQSALTRIASKPRLAPLQIDSDPLMPGDEADLDMGGDVPLHDNSPDTGEVDVQPRVPDTPARTPRAHRDSALQGATARNQAAIAAHRARLHMKEHGAAEHGWATPARKALVPSSPRGEASQRSSSPRAGSAVASPRPPLTRFGSVASPSNLRSAQSLSPAAMPRAVLGRGGSVALPSTLRHAQRPGLSLRAKSSSPTLQRGASVTVAQIMKQNSRLPPLDLFPSVPSSPRSALRPLPPLRRGFSVAAPASPTSPLQRAVSLMKRRRAVAPSSSAGHGSSKPQGSPSERSAERSPDSPGTQPSPRRSSLTQSRRKIMLPPLQAQSPRQTGLMRGVSGSPASPNK